MKILQLTVILIAAAAAIAVAQTEPAALQVVLPAEAVIESAQATLSSVCALTGSPERVEKAGALTIGTFVSRGQIICVDRNTILCRLASIGIEASSVELSGAEVVKIKRRETVIDSDAIIQAAKAFLEKQLAGRKVASLSLFRRPVPITLDDPNTSRELTCRMSRYQTAGSAKVDVVVCRDDVELGCSEVVFAVRYKTRRAVAVEDIEPGQIVTTDNVQFEEVETLSPNQKDQAEPFGLQVRRKITRGSAVHADNLTPRQAPVLIRRNQQVLVKIDTGGLFLSAPGQAMDEGRIGDLIRVRRGQRPDEVTIYGTVQPDGSVRPQL